MKEDLINRNEMREEINRLNNILNKKREIKNLTLDSLINEFDSITAGIHKLFAEHFSEKLVTHKFGIINETEKTYARYANMQGKIDSYIRKLELLSNQENLDNLYNAEKLSSSICDTELSRKDAKSGLSELKQMSKGCKDTTEKEYIDNIISGYTNATNTLLRMVVNLLNQNGKINLIKGKDFSFLS